METILTELRTAGYAVIHRVLNARAVVPQRRQRLYWLGFLRDRGGEAAAKDFQWPAWADDADKDLEEFSKCKWYSTEQGALHTERSRGWPTVGAKLEKAEAVWEAHQLTSSKLENVARQDLYWNHSLKYHFVNERGAARTLIGSYLKLGRSDQLVAPPAASKDQAERQPRLFTIRECCRIMGFPEWYNLPSEKRAYHELGNAVCPPVITAIAKQMLATGVIPMAAGEDSDPPPKRKKKKKQSKVSPEADLSVKASDSGPIASVKKKRKYGKKRREERKVDSKNRRDAAARTEKREAAAAEAA